MAENNEAHVAATATTWIRVCQARKVILARASGEVFSHILLFVRALGDLNYPVFFVC